MEICDIYICHYVIFQPNDEILNIKIIPRNKIWFYNILPNLIKFWNDVEIYRKNNPEWFKIYVNRNYLAYNILSENAKYVPKNLTEKISSKYSEKKK